MIYLIHGENLVDSRRFLVKIKGSYEEVETIEGKNLREERLREVLAQSSRFLFGGKSAILIENFDGNWQALPKKLAEDVDIVLWSSKKIDLGPLPVKNFVFNKINRVTSFKLADAILFKDEKDAQILAASLLDAKEPIEKIIGALSRSFYLAYCVKEESVKSRDLPVFVLGKLQDQAKGWTRSALKKAIIYLIGLDVASKEGAKPKAALAAYISRVINF